MSKPAAIQNESGHPGCIHSPFRVQHSESSLQLKRSPAQKSEQDGIFHLVFMKV